MRGIRAGVIVGAHLFLAIPMRGNEGSPVYEDGHNHGQFSHPHEGNEIRFV